jgi:hypothetical protein
MDAERLIKLQELSKWITEGMPMHSNNINTVFELNNYFFPHLREFGRGCGACRQRVTNRLKTFFDSEGKIQLDTIAN